MGYSVAALFSKQREPAVGVVEAKGSQHAALTALKALRKVREEHERAPLAALALTPALALGKIGSPSKRSAYFAAAAHEAEIEKGMQTALRFWDDDLEEDHLDDAFDPHAACIAMDIYADAVEDFDDIGDEDEDEADYGDVVLEYEDVAFEYEDVAFDEVADAPASLLRHYAESTEELDHPLLLAAWTGAAVEEDEVEFDAMEYYGDSVDMPSFLNYSGVETPDVPTFLSRFFF